MVIAAAWFLFAVGVMCVVGLVVLIAVGARVEKIVWADQAVVGMLGAAAVLTVSLYALGSLAGNAFPVRLGLSLGLSEAATIIFILMPIALLVVRVRKRKGWMASIAGKPPVSK